MNLIMLNCVPNIRTTNHKLPIEQGKWNNIGRSNRWCILCNKNEIGDEIHYILKCKYVVCQICISEIST
jgi:hypothetical protein